MPISGEALLKAYRVFSRIYQDAGLSRGLSFANNYHWRTFIMFHRMQVTTDKAHKHAHARGLHAMRPGGNRQWLGSVPGAPLFHDQVMNLLSFNDHALPRLHETLKDALDPNGILSPGRYGIWPKHLRRSRS